MNLWQLFKHRKEIIRAAERLGWYRDGEFIVLDGLNIGFRGTMGAQLWQPTEVLRACEAGDVEKEAWARRVARKLIGEGGRPEMLLAMAEEGPNTWVDEGMTEALDVFLGYSTQNQYHYFLIGNLDVTPATGWTLGTGGTKIRTTFGEFTDYDEATREVWTFAAAASKSITNSASPASITCNASGTLRGAALCNKSAKDGSTDNTGYAVAAKRFDADYPAADTNVLNIVHTLSASAT